MESEKVAVLKLERILWGKKTQRQNTNHVTVKVSTNHKICLH